MQKDDYFEPEDDGLLAITEMQKDCIKEYIVVCIRRDKNFPLIYAKTMALSPSEAIEITQKNNPLVKVLRAYQAK